MENNYKLNKNQAIALMVIIMINKLILNVPFYIVNLVGNAAIVNIIYVSIIDFIGLLIIIKLFEKFDGLDLIDISEFLGKNFLKSIVSILTIGLLFTVAFITIIDFSNVLHTIYFSDFSNIYIITFFIVAALIANLVNFKSIANVICFIIPFSIISIIITFLTRFSDLNIHNLTPILGNSYHTTFVTGLSNTFSMYFIVYIYFLKPLLEDQSDFKKVSINSFIISFFILVFTIMPILTLFNTSESAEPINSLFLIARQIEFGDFLQRVDALFILLWILTIFSYLSFIIFLINQIIKKNINISNEKMLSYSTCSILFGLSLIPLNVASTRFIENTLYRFLIIGFMFGLGLLILVAANIKYRKVKINDKK